MSLFGTSRMDNFLQTALISLVAFAIGYQTRSYFTPSTIASPSSGSNLAVPSVTPSESSSGKSIKGGNDQQSREKSSASRAARRAALNAVADQSGESAEVGMEEIPASIPSSLSPSRSKSKSRPALSSGSKKGTGSGSDSGSDSELDTDSEAEDLAVALSSNPHDIKPTAFDEVKLVLVVNDSLKMSKGKIAAQAGHATLGCALLMKEVNPRMYKHWERHGQPKIALRCADTQELENLAAQARRLSLCARTIQDAGRTQVAAGSKTILGIGPGPARIINQVTGKLKLL